jgi:diaminopimelate epimerase
MFIEFYKYQGTGNDFIIVDDRQNLFDHEDHALVSALCERKMGIGADGLILLRDHNDCDFEMIYFNSDGYISTMCGNGGRCIVSFAAFLNIIEQETTFMAVDGLHNAKIIDDEVALQMRNVEKVEQLSDGIFIDTGSPHYVKLENHINGIDVKSEGRKIRNSSKFKKEGVNVNFVECNENTYVRTYERGVEDETLSCGTGVVATAIALHYTNYLSEDIINIQTKGGELSVSFDEYNGSYRNIWLTGRADIIYIGEFSC